MRGGVIIKGGEINHDNNNSNDDTDNIDNGNNDDNDDNNDDTVGFHNFNLRIFDLRVSNPKKLIVDVFF